MVRTTRVSGRRQLHFASYQDILDDARQMAARPNRQLGNWSLGQICVHLAKGMEMAIEGAAFTPPWPIRAIGPFFKRRTLRGPMKPGFRLPRKASSLLPAATSAADGLETLARSIARMQQVTEPHRHAVLGPMTRAEWDQLHFRHAEMHLSFIVPE